MGIPRVGRVPGPGVAKSLAQQAAEEDVHPAARQRLHVARREPGDVGGEVGGRGPVQEVGLAGQLVSRP